MTVSLTGAFLALRCLTKSSQTDCDTPSGGATAVAVFFVSCFMVNVSCFMFG
jgi:hypothetical protein